MKELTKAEEQVMQILWEIEKGFVNEILDQINEPKPAYNTVSTIIRILEKKGFVGHKAYGKTYEYFPLVLKDEYKKNFLKRMMKSYFSDSFQSLTSFFAQDQNLSIQELEEIKKILEDQIITQKSREK